MKKTLILLSILFASSISFATVSPFEKSTHDCIGREMIKQFPIYSRVAIGEFATWALNDVHIDYMIMLKNPQTGRVDSRSFILIRNDFSNAALYLTENSTPSKIDLKNCF